MVAARQLKREYEDEGATLKELAARHGLSYYKVRRMLVDHGVELRGAGPVPWPAPDGMVTDYVVHGVSIEHLAWNYDLSFGVTRRMLLAEGVELRPKGERANEHPDRGFH
ncbi:helix-turn-helix domain-containing protein [Amycolatopsis thailandensis]|uniref:helix-turn-helix domain-containing protein n=1 Tax=Amycolatopsis thailandensis TaxID=589330 RepID=UPI003643921A